jgi:hypothetical protein
MNRNRTVTVRRASELVLVAALFFAPTLSSFAQGSLGLAPAQGPGPPQAVGTRLTFVCPAGDGRASVYGTDVYTAESGVCAAAIHAGVLALGQPGAVTIVFGAGAESFRGSERNGVTTRSYGRWPQSYTFARDAAPGRISWRTAWNQMPAEFAGPLLLECPPGGSVDGAVWGTDTYTRESVICVAAVHAGAITAEKGGLIEVRRARNTGEFAATERNGVRSQRYASYQDAFAVRAATPTRATAQSSAAAGCPLATAIAQTFDEMKADVARQYDALIRQTENNAAQSAALLAQRDRLLGQIDELKRQNLETACSVPPRVTQNTGGGAAPTAGALPVLDRPPPSLGSLPPRQAAPQLSSIEPAALTQSDANIEVSLRGVGTSWRMGATQVDLGAGITKVAGPFFTSTTEGYMVVTVAPDAPLGPRRVTVTTPLDEQNEVVGLPDTLLVTAPQLVATAGIMPAAVVSAVTAPSTPAATQTPPAAPAPAPSPPRPSGWYVVTLNEIICYTPTRDNQLSLDGRGDEIFAAAFIRGYDRSTGRAFPRTVVRKTRVYGDSAGGTRIQAGSRSAAGGIQEWDTIPDGGSLRSGVIGRLVPPQDDRIPWKIWEGELANGLDAIAISLSVWESDGKERTYLSWVAQQERITEQLWTHGTVAQRIAAQPMGFSLLQPFEIGATITANGAIAIADRAALAIAAIASGGVLIPSNEMADILSGGADRPVGVRRYDSSVGSDIIVPNTLLVLTRELAEATLAGYVPQVVPAVGRQLLTPGPGYMLATFADRESQYGPGQYMMILQIERGTPSEGGGVGPARPNSQREREELQEGGSQSSTGSGPGLQLPGSDEIDRPANAEKVEEARQEP